MCKQWNINNGSVHRPPASLHLLCLHWKRAFNRRGGFFFVCERISTSTIISFFTTNLTKWLSLAFFHWNSIKLKARKFKTFYAIWSRFVCGLICEWMNFQCWIENDKNWRRNCEWIWRSKKYYLKFLNLNAKLSTQIFCLIWV